MAIIPSSASPSAKKVYANEVTSLDIKLDIAKRNKPMEREAQRVATSIIQRKQESNPNMDDDDLKKTRNQALATARVRTGAKKIPVELTDREWEAIQAGAVSPSKTNSFLVGFLSAPPRISPRTTGHTIMF